MNSNTTYNFFALPLMIAGIILLCSIEGLYPSYSLITFDSGRQISLCKKVNLPSSMDLPSELNTLGHDASTSQGSKAAFSCSMSLQMIPVEKQMLISPPASTVVAPLFKPIISSLAFVFREPDPPQFS